MTFPRSSLLSVSALAASGSRILRLKVILGRIVFILIEPLKTQFSSWIDGIPGLRDLQCGKTRLHTSVSHLLKHISVKRIKIVIVFAVIVLVKVIVVPGEKLNFKVFVFNERNKNFN